jgi:hypothetical protein
MSRADALAPAFGFALGLAARGAELQARFAGLHEFVISPRLMLGAD